MRKDEVYKITSENDGDTEVSRSYVWMNIRVKDAIVWSSLKLMFTLKYIYSINRIVHMNYSR